MQPRRFAPVDAANCGSGTGRGQCEVHGGMLHPAAASRWLRLCSQHPQATAELRAGAVATQAGLSRITSKPENWTIRTAVDADETAGYTCWGMLILSGSGEH